MTLTVIDTKRTFEELDHVTEKFNDGIDEVVIALTREHEIGETRKRF